MNRSTKSVARSERPIQIEFKNNTECHWRVPLWTDGKRPPDELVVCPINREVREQLETALREKRIVHRRRGKSEPTMCYTVVSKSRGAFILTSAKRVRRR